MAKIIVETDDGTELTEIKISGDDWNLNRELVRRVFLPDYLIGEIIPALWNAFDREAKNDSKK